MDGYEGVLSHTEMDTFNTVVRFHNILDACLVLVSQVTLLRMWSLRSCVIIIPSSNPVHY